MPDQNIDIAIRAKNQASSTLKQVKADVQGLDSLAKTASGGLGGIAAGLGIGATVALVGQVTSAIDEMAQSADRLDRLRGSFDSLAQGAGQSSDQMLQAMRAASNGMIADSDLILSANKAMLLGVADSGEELAALLRVAQARGQAMGLSVTQAFSDIVTGLGRESALILDNLGITVDLTSVMDNYAKSLGVAADQLDAAQRKQALLNEVMRQSQGMTPSLPTGPGAAAAQAEVAQQQAREAVGEFFRGPSREWAQNQTDILNTLMGKYSEFGAAVREVNQTVAQVGSGEVNMGDDFANRLNQWAIGLNEVAQAAATGLPEAKAYLDTLASMSRRGLESGFTEQDINIMRLARDAIHEATAERERAGKAAAAAAAHYIEEATAQQHAAQMAYQATEAYAENVRQHEALVAAAWRASPAMQEMANKFGIVGTMALQAATDINTFNNAVNRIQAGFAAADRIQGIRMTAISAAEANAQRAVDAGADPVQVAQGLAEVTDQIWNMAGPTEQTTDSMFLFRQETDAAGQSLEDQADSLEKANRAAAKLASGGLAQVNKAYDDLKSKVSGVLSAQLDVGVGVKASDLLPREDDINENAKRLADIAVNGFKDQPWLDAFKFSAPETWAELMKSIEEGASPQEAAARILKDFEDGLQTDLIDKTKAKERVKRMLLGEQSMAALAEEIAQELAAEMNIPLSQAMAAAGSALGVSTGAAGEAAAGATGETGAPDMTGAGQGAGATFAAGFAASVNGATLIAGVVTSMATADLEPLNSSGAMAGTQWGAGFVENASGAVLVASIIAKIAAELPRFKDSGASAGTQWGAGFMGTVETGIAQPLINLLTTLVTPGVLAAIQAGNSQTTPP